MENAQVKKRARKEDGKEEHVVDTTTTGSNHTASNSNGIASSLIEDSSDSDMLSLNVGGKTGIIVSRGTLTMAAEHSLLAAKFSTSRNNAHNDAVCDKDGNYFIDQSPSVFLPLLDCLRSIARSKAPTAFAVARPTPDNTNAFQIMVEQMTILP